MPGFVNFINKLLNSKIRISMPNFIKLVNKLRITELFITDKLLSKRLSPVVPPGVKFFLKIKKVVNTEGV